MLKFPEEGSPASVTLVPDLKKESTKTQYMIKLRPHRTKFIETNNPKAVLEYQLRNFTCLHEGDTITITAFNEKFDIDILEITPKTPYNAICIIDTDVNVDFAPPLDYEEPSKKETTVKEEVEAKKGSVFGGKGVRIDEKEGKGGLRKASTVPEEEEYDPRRHRIHRGIRKVSNDFIGTGVKIQNAVGSRK